MSPTGQAQSSFAEVSQPHSPADSGALSVSSIENRVCSGIIDPMRMSWFIIHTLFKSV